MREIYSLLLAIAATATLTAQNFTGGFNFNLPAYDGSAQTFLPNFAAVPITSAHQVSAATTGKFMSNGSPIRFWGVNLTTSACFPEKTLAPGIASRMRKMGINLVRFHHMDNPGWGSTIFQNASVSTRTLSTTNLDKLDYFIAQLKANGIFVNMNLNVSRTFRPADGVPAADSLRDFAKGLTLFDPWMQFLQREYAQQILSHVNPYTGLALAADPVLAMVETNNENSLYGFWRADELRPFAQGGRLPVVYNTRLDSAWTAFLRTKYQNSSRLLADSWAAGIVPAGFGEQATNGGFDSGNPPSGWSLVLNGGATGTIVADPNVKTAGAASAKLRATKLGSQNWHIQYQQVGFSVKKDTAYTLRFKAKTSGAGSKQMVVFVRRNDGAQPIYSQQTFNLTSAWQSFELVVAPSEANAGQVRVAFSPQALGYFWLDEVSFRPLWQCPPPQILPDQISNGGFETGAIAPWQLELHSGAAATLTASTTNPQSGSRCGQLAVTNVTGTDWHLQMKQVGGNVQKDSSYLLEFWARAAAGTPTIAVNIMRDNSPYTWYTGANVSLSTGWKKFTVSVVPPEDNSGFLRIAFLPLQNTGTFFFDNVKFGKMSGSGLQPNEQLATASVLRSLYSQRSFLTDNRLADVAEFYTTLEKTHLQNLRNFLKTNLGVVAPITGSNALNGHQDVWRHEQMDYLDDHSYWDHPQFPGVPWDGWNWFINNTSLLKDQYFGSIANVVSGLQFSKKPYTISEYNHGFPNRFRTEMVPALAAYSAFHGVDGVMFFEYQGSSDWASDAVPGYFSLNRDHSVMGLFPSCAWAYRQGYMAEATSPTLINYNPSWIYRTPRWDGGQYWDKYVAYDKRVGLTNAVRTLGFTNPSNPDFSVVPPVPSGNIFTTSNNQTRLDNNLGILTTATTKFCAISGFLNAAPNTTAGDLRLTSGSDFGAITWVSLTGQTLRTATSSLISVSSKLQNSGMIWDGTTTVHDDWGNAPTQIFPLTVNLRLRSNASSICVQALGTQGQPVGTCTTYLPSAGGFFDIVLNQNSTQTLWFGVSANFGAVPISEDRGAKNPVSEFKIFPNPTAGGQVNLDFELGADSEVSLEIFDAAGRAIRRVEMGELAAGEQVISLEINGLAAGIYTCRLLAGEAVFVSKIVKE